MISVHAFLSSLFESYTAFNITLPGGAYIPGYTLVAFLIYCFVIWFVARLCRFIYLRIKDLVCGLR